MWIWIFTFIYGAWGFEFENLKFLIEPKDVTVSTGAEFRLECGVDGDGYNYKWHKNGDIIPNQNSNVLLIENCSERDSGSYECSVVNKNQHGIVSRIAKVHVIGMFFTYFVN